MVTIIKVLEIEATHIQIECSLRLALAAHEIFRQNASTDLYRKSAATAPKLFILQNSQS